MFQIGQRLEGRYQLRQQLRAQPTRQTWLATDHQAPSKPKPVIIKFLAFGRGMAWDEMKLFEREVQVLQQLNHPQIPQYLDSFNIPSPEPWLGLIQEYISGKNLQALIDKGQPFSESQIYDLATQVLRILIYLHEQYPPILHRDIKPSNLILTPDQTVFLVDFGAVQNQLPQIGRSFTVVGTYGYTPLEQFGGQAVPASDLYSLGATLVHVLTGLAPAELTQPDLRLQFREGPRSAYALRIACNSHRITLTHHLATWLEKMTAPALADRFDSARAALLALTPPHASPSPAPVLGTSTQRLQLETNPKHLQVRIYPIWSAPLLRLQDLAGMTFLTLLGPVVFGALSLLPLGLIFTRQALVSGDISGMSLGLLLLCLGSIPWFTGLNWLKQNLTSTIIESLGHCFVIKYQLWGWTYWQYSSFYKDITEIYSVPLTGEEETVMINCTSRAALALANHLNRSDSQLLIQTLQQWMTRDKSHSPV
ncbi:serine/threonine-protein kinase [Acaryochloris sp. IP29b_bin.137]|uniref:serine/threonine protein kinase n=1 Tax=Acaryochloris sp. IP29b_bin.137 TaxID=2969217 RepID=UPI00261CAB3A|nr:serine/threonine-protein kinase [Acaryochloris sp. IP29b_bin.137]